MQDILINIEKEADEITGGGDFIAGESDEQQVQMILVSSPGDWKLHPEMGAALKLSQNGTVDRNTLRNVRVQLAADGFTINKLDVTTDGIQIDGQY